MASKLILVPEDIYRGLTSSDTGDINLDFTRRNLEKTKRLRTNSTTKNVLYNQQLAKYLKLRADHENKPAKVEFSKGLRALVKRGDDSEEEEVEIEFNPSRPPRRRQRRNGNGGPPPPGPPSQGPPPPSPPHDLPPSFSPTPPAPPRQPGAPQAPPAQPGPAPPPPAAPLNRKRRELAISDFELPPKYRLLENQYPPVSSSVRRKSAAARLRKAAFHQSFEALSAPLSQDEDFERMDESRPSTSRVRRGPAIVWQEGEVPLPVASRQVRKRKIREISTATTKRRTDVRENAGGTIPTTRIEGKKKRREKTLPYPARNPMIKRPEDARIEELPDDYDPSQAGTSRQLALPPASSQQDEENIFLNIPTSKLSTDQLINRYHIWFNRNKDKYRVRGDKILTDEGKAVPSSSLRKSLHYLIDTRAGRRRLYQPPGTKFIQEKIDKDIILRSWMRPQLPKRLQQASKTGVPTQQMDLIKTTLDRLYNNPKSSSAFAGVDRLWKEARKELGNRIQKRDVEEYLQHHRTYTLTRPRRVHFPRAKTVPAGFMTDVQVDLADFKTLSYSNKGNRYLLLGIDVLSKRIFVVPLRSKKADAMVEGFKQLLAQMPMKPHRIFSDKGNEFTNAPLLKLFKEEEIDKHESIHSSVKAALAERAIRTVKSRLYRFFAHHNSLNWMDTVQQIVAGINRSPSRALPDGLRPIDVNFKNAQRIWKKIYGEDMHRSLFGKKREKKPKFTPGQTVRMTLVKPQFEKGYISNYGDEILEVDAAMKHMRPIRYKLRDEKGEKFKGFFYGEELAPVHRDADTTYRIERVFRKRTRPDGTKEILVKFIGYPEREWIHESQLV